MLGVGAAVAIPSIIGNIHKDLCAVGGKLPDFIGEDGFVADKNSQLFISRIQWLTRCALGKVATSLVSPSAKENIRRKGTYSPKGTR